MTTRASSSSDFESLPIHIQENWTRKAIDHLDRTGISFNDDDRDAVVYMTTIWLYSLQDFINTRPIMYPCYVVHCVEEGWRFVTDSFQIAHSKFKKAQARKDGMGITHRAALFHWTAKRVCEMRYASPNYPYDTDHIPV